MKKTILLFFLTGFSVLTASSQAIFKNMKSTVLNGERQIKILPPRDYGANPEQVYPLIIVLDGDYLFEPVAGNVDYLSYFDQMPESIVVGINMLQSRYTETEVDQNSGLPMPDGQKFMDFVMEVKEKMEKDYRIAPFTVMVGQDITANFATFYLMRDLIPIEAFIQIKPEYSKLIQANLVPKLQRRKKINFFYVGTTATDTSMDGMITNQVDTTGVGGIRTNIQLDKFEGTNKYSVASNAIPNGLQFVFRNYAIIDDEFIEDLASEEEVVEETETLDPAQELETDLPETMETETAEDGEEAEVEEEKPKKRSEQLNAVNKLIEKQKLIYKTYGFIQKHRLVDIVKLANLLIEREDWDSLINLGELTSKEHPEKLYGDFLQGLGYEGIGRVQRAIKSYEKAYTLQPAAGVNLEIVLDRIALLKEARD